MKRIIKAFTLLAMVVATLASCNGNKKTEKAISEIPNTITVKGVSFQMSVVEPQTFAMGYTPLYRKVKGATIHQVILDGFAIGNVPVSKELWKAVMGSEPSVSSSDNQTVVGITFKNSQKFLKKLSKLSGYEFRLPTEAEWEIAARSGKSQKTGVVYEYCSDKYAENYAPDMDINPQGPADGGEYVVRSPEERSGMAPTSKSNSIGMRVVVSLNKPYDKNEYSTLTTSNQIRETGTLNTVSFNANGVSFKMIAVEGGKFQMGSTSEQASYGDKDEAPVHEVKLDGFLMGETEVTAGLWNAVMGYLPLGNFKDYPEKPVVNVSWYDAQVFIFKLNKITHRFFRLPTEAEWEFAARGGQKSSHYRFSGSNTIDQVAIYKITEVENVRSRRANEIGLYDMSGNAWEWCEDFYGNYAPGLQTNPTGEMKGEERVTRGGSANSDWSACRVSNRSHLPANSVKASFGFRLAI
jgi:formylglycine-generating enzyme required for sulfatase activity